MIQASNLKRGMVFDVNKTAQVVEKVHAKSPSARGGTTLYKIRARNLVTGQKVDHSFKGDDMVGEVDYEKHAVEYSYIEADNYVFMDLESFEQYELNRDIIGEDSNYLLEGMECMALFIDGKLEVLTLPDVVELKIVECDPSIKSASATARTKNAVLETGLEVQVPEYIGSEEVVRVDTRTGEYLSRVKS